MTIRALERALSITTRLAADLAGLVVLIMMLVGVFDVAGRYLLNAPLASGFEIVQFSMVLVVFGSLASCAYSGGHVTINILEGLLSRPAGRWIRALVHGIGAALFMVIAWRSAAAALEYFGSHEVSNMLRVPLYPFVAVVAFGTGLFGLVLALKTARAFSGEDGGRS